MGVTLAVALAGTPSAAAAERTTLSVRGGTPTTAEICGAQRTVVHAARDDRLVAVMRLPRAARRGNAARRTARRARLVVERCAAGRWRFAHRLRLGSARGRGRYRRTIRTGAPRQIRLTVRLGPRGRRSARAYVRVQDDVVSRPVSFRVRNINRSRLDCASDGGEYTVAGRLVGLRESLKGPAAAGVTLYLHEYSWGRFFWDFPVSEYDYATQLADAGHASVVIDRLGYDASSRPQGSATCLGSAADVASQIVGQLRGGGYEAGGAPVRFGRVALAGHSVGGAIAELAAYSFGGIDALVLFAYADQGYTPGAIGTGGEQSLKCGQGGEPADPGGPGGYAYFSATEEGFRGFSFHSAEPAIAERAAAMRNRDPCGEVSSLVPATASNTRYVGEIGVPVLLLYGDRDAVYDQPAAGENQKGMFSGSPDVTLEFLPETGHALTLERSAPRLRAIASGWLGKRGF